MRIAKINKYLTVKKTPGVMTTPGVRYMLSFSGRGVLQVTPFR